MRYRLRVGEIPDGSVPLTGQPVAARRVDTGETLGASVTDDQGFVTFQADGHWPPFYLHLSDVPGGDKYWRSDESHTTGPITPKEIPVALMALGDGVVRGYTSMLAVSLFSGGPDVSVAPGAANVAGHPVVFYGSFFGSTVIPNTRPASGIRYDIVYVGLNPEGSTTLPGYATVGIAHGSVGGGLPSLLNNSDTVQFPLAQLTVPAAGAIALTDIRQYTGEPVLIAASSSSVAESTAHALGEYLPHLDLSLTLAPATTYDVTAWVTATADVAGGITPALTFGSFGSLESPPQFRNVQQVAVDSTGVIFVTDPDNGRTLAVNPDGTLLRDNQVDGIYGVCVDASDYVYLVGQDVTAPLGVRGWGWKYPPQFPPVIPTWQWGPPTGSADLPYHCATDGTYLFYTVKDFTGFAALSRRDASTGTNSVTIDTDLNDPLGVAYYGGEFYVVDTGNTRVKVYNAAGTVTRTWSIPARGSGIAIDSTGRVYIAFTGDNVVRRYTVTGVFQDDFPTTGPLGLATGPSNSLWVSSTNAHNLTRYDLVPPGYGKLAIDINVQGAGPYTGIGNVSGSVQLTQTYTLNSGLGGPMSVRLAGQATAGTATFRNIVFSARAVPRGV